MPLYCLFYTELPPSFKVENSILKKALHYTPLWEYQGIGSLYIDLTGTRNLWGRGIDVAHRLRNEIKKISAYQG